MKPYIIRKVECTHWVLFTRDEIDIFVYIEPRIHFDCFSDVLMFLNGEPVLAVEIA